MVVQFTNGLIIFLGIVTCGFFTIEVTGCDLTAVTACTSILGRNTNISVMNEGLSAIPSADQLTALCKSLGEFKACYEPKAAECRNDVIFSMTFGTVQKTIAYLCEEGFNDILRYASCWNRTDVTEETTQCHVAQSDMITSLQQQSDVMNSTQMRQGWCEILSNTTSCMSGVVEEGCGPAPACIMHTMMSRALDGLSGLMKCPPPEECFIGDYEISTEFPPTTVPVQSTPRSNANTGDNFDSNKGDNSGNNSGKQSNSNNIDTYNGSEVVYSNLVCFIISVSVSVMYLL